MTTPAFAYYRMSSDQQCGSIRDQKNEVEAWASQAGYQIIQEYVDEGRSAFEDPSKRVGFQKMIKDATTPGTSVKAIVCWDVSRFGRSHPMKMASVKDRLNNAGIHLATKKQGRLDWETFQGLIVDLLYASQANEFSKSLSADSVRGRIKTIEDGEYPNGAIPFGYDRLYTDNLGTTYKVARTAKFKKPRGWRLQLTIHEDEAKIVRWLFRQFLDRDISMRQLAREAADKEAGNPNTLAWSKDTVKGILKNKCYAGFAHIGGANARLRQKEVANRIGAREMAGVVPPLVTLEEWEHAQRLIDTRKEQGWKVRPSNASPIGGCLICGRCGYRLEKKERSDRGGERYRFFSCPSAIKRPQLGCKQWRVRETEILPVALEWLVKVVDREVLAQQDAFRLLDQAEEQGGKDATPLEALQARLGALQRKIDKGRERYLGAPGDLLAGLERTLNEWQAEQSQVEKEIRVQTVTKDTVTNFTEWWEDARSRLVTVIPSHDEVVEGSEFLRFHAGVSIEPERLRRMLKDLGFRLVIHWRPKPNSSRYWELDRARITADLSHPMGVASTSHLKSVFTFEETVSLTRI